MMRIGIDLGGTKIEGIVLDDDGSVVVRRRVSTPAHDYQSAVDAIVALVAELEAVAGPAASVGIGTPGAISPATGCLKNSNTVSMNGQPLHTDLSERLQRPVRMANDADCFALSEAVDGAGAGAGVVFGVIVGTGTGGGIVVRGELLSGPNAIAGEWGHNPLPWPRADELPGPDCYCGKRGCIETWLSGPGLARDFHRATGLPIAPPEIVELAGQGDAQALAVLDDYADRMARALASVINVIDPDVIVLGGGMSNIGRLYDEVPRIWGKYVFSDRVDTRLLPAVHGDSGGVRGAAWLWPVEERGEPAA